MASVAAGCSAAFVYGPTAIQAPAAQPADPPQIACTRSRVVPWVDTVVAAGFTVGSIAKAVEPCDAAEFGCIGKVSLLLSVPMAIGFGASALWGHMAVSECREVLAAVSRPPAPGSGQAGAPPALLIPGQPPAGARFAIVVAPGDVRTAPYAVAPLLMQLAPGQRVPVAAEPRNGWRSVTVPDGRTGYIKDGELRLE